MRRDLKEMIEFIASQPWCNGKVGMVGCSYFGMSQLLGAEQQPAGLAAIFPYDAATDLHRDAYHHGGIYSAWGRFWFTCEVVAGGEGRQRSNRYAAIILTLLTERPYPS